PEIARSEIAVCIESFGVKRRIDVSGHEGFSLDTDLTRLICACVRPVIPHNDDVHAPTRSTIGQCSSMIGVTEHTPTHEWTFSHAVTGNYSGAELCLCLIVK